MCNILTIDRNADGLEMPFRPEALYSIRLAHPFNSRESYMLEVQLEQLQPLMDIYRYKLAKELEGLQFQISDGESPEFAFMQLLATTRTLSNPHPGYLTIYDMATSALARMELPDFAGIHPTYVREAFWQLGRNRDQQKTFFEAVRHKSGGNVSLKVLRVADLGNILLRYPDSTVYFEIRCGNESMSIALCTSSEPLRRLY
jgi:hypothetical protein